MRRLQMKVFEEEWLKDLSQRYDYKLKYTSPFIAKLAFDPMLKPERDIIELWFDHIVLYVIDHQLLKQ